MFISIHFALVSIPFLSTKPLYTSLVTSIFYWTHQKLIRIGNIDSYYKYYRGRFERHGELSYYDEGLDCLDLGHGKFVGHFRLSIWKILPHSPTSWFFHSINLRALQVKAIDTQEFCFLKIYDTSLGRLLKLAIWGSHELEPLIKSSDYSVKTIGAIEAIGSTTLTFSISKWSYSVCMDRAESIHCSSPTFPHLRVSLFFVSSVNKTKFPIEKISSSYSILSPHS